MNVGLVLILSLLWLGLGLFVYSRWLARWMGVDPSRPTPALVQRDGVDFEPAPPAVLFGHHFASIAAAGPIVGPALAAMFGFVPAWLWLLGGVVLIGAVHDFAALFVSMREGGRSIAEVARRVLGRAGFLLYAAFAVMLCILVGAAFLDLTARTLTSTLPLEVLGLDADQRLLATRIVDGRLHGRLGGVASTSVVLITLAAPALGWLVHRRGLGTLPAALGGAVVCTLSVAAGLVAPIDLAPTAWMVVVLVYTVLAGFVPVWLLIQPRDFINVQFLYAGLVLMLLSLLGCGLHGVTLDLPAFNLSEAEQLPSLGVAWPFLFITIACGSVSGAHGLIAGGTTSKQVASEAHARWIGYGGMLLESLLGICVLLLLGGAVGYAGYRAAIWDEGAPGAAAAFALAVGQGLFQGLGSPVGGEWLVAFGTIFGMLLLEGFLVTTIDTVVRLARYLLEEAWSALTPRPPPHRLVTTGLVVGPVALLAFTNGYTSIWPVFGGANQLLAALTLVAVTAWLADRRRAWWYTGLPAVFMVLTSIVALWGTFRRELAAGGLPVALASLVLVVLALGVLGVVAGWWRRRAVAVA